jgi:hypothetical protein
MFENLLNNGEKKEEENDKSGELCSFVESIFLFLSTICSKEVNLSTVGLWSESFVYWDHFVCVVCGG